MMPILLQRRFVAATAIVGLILLATSVTGIIIDRTAAMCVDVASNPVHSLRTITTVDYPAMVSSTQCQCTIMPTVLVVPTNATSTTTTTIGPNDVVNDAAVNMEIILRVELQRKDNTDECVSTKVLVISHDNTFVVCPHSTGGAERPPDITIPMTHAGDQIVVSLRNPDMEFISVRITATPDPEEYTDIAISCLDLGVNVWGDQQSSTSLDDVSGGIKAAIVIIIILFMIVIAAVTKYFATKKMLEKQRLKKYQRRRERLEKIRQRQQLGGDENLAFSFSSSSPRVSTNDLHNTSIDNVQVLNVCMEGSRPSTNPLTTASSTDSTSVPSLTAGRPLPTFLPFRISMISNGNETSASSQASHPHNMSFHEIQQPAMNGKSANVRVCVEGTGQRKRSLRKVKKPEAVRPTQQQEISTTNGECFQETGSSQLASNENNQVEANDHRRLVDESTTPQKIRKRMRPEQDNHRPYQTSDNNGQQQSALNSHYDTLPTGVHNSSVLRPFEHNI